MCTHELYVSMSDGCLDMSVCVSYICAYILDVNREKREKKEKKKIKEKNKTEEREKERNRERHKRGKYDVI